MEDPVASPKMTLKVFKSCFCELLSKFFTSFSLRIFIKFVHIKMCNTRIY